MSAQLRILGQFWGNEDMTGIRQSKDVEYLCFIAASYLAKARNRRLLESAKIAEILTEFEACARQNPAEACESLTSKGLARIIRKIKVAPVKQKDCQKLFERLEQDNYPNYCSQRYREGQRCYWLGHRAYPQSLLMSPSPPSPIFVRSASAERLTERFIEAQNDTFICVVGTRKASAYGLRLSEDCARWLAGCGFTLISGMAYGIDSACQRSILQHGGKTWAVLAGSCEHIYPSEHHDLAASIMKNGFLISEQAPGTRAVRGFFHSRNRIMSAISQAVLVLEATQRSGTWSTAEHALAQNRPIWVAPGNIYSPTSQGCNRLLANGIPPLLSFELLEEELRLYDICRLSARDKVLLREQKSKCASEDQKGRTELKERDLIDYLAAEEASAEELLHRCSCQPNELFEALARLQSADLIDYRNGRYRVIQ